MTRTNQKYANLSIHGLDVGNATCKTNTGIIFDSKITTTEPLTKTNTLTIDGITYYLGAGSFDTTYKKIDKEHYIKFMYGLLALSTSTVHNKIVLGLPLSQFSSDRNQLINMIMHNNEKIVTINGEEKPLIIDDVAIMPEGISTLPENIDSIIIDVGGLTTDVALVRYEREERRIIKPISIAIGTINLYTDLINKINSKYSLNLKIDDAERILEKGLTLDGKKENINFALEMYQEFYNDLINQLQVNYSIRTNNLSLTGGGASIIYEQLKNKFGDSVTMQDNSIFANARNFYDLGLSIFDGEE